MPLGPAEVDAQLALQIQAMAADRFELLTFELARVELDGVQKLSAPDGGADVRGPGARPRVWQAKHYTKAINWPECEGSLDRAVETWASAHVTYVFPRDLSAPLRAAFDMRLAARHPGVRVDAWTLADLISRLRSAPNLRRRFFGPEYDDIADVVDRAVAAGGTIDDLTSMVRRVGAIGEFLQEHDEQFEMRVTTGPATGRAGAVSASPDVWATVPAGAATVRIDAWRRPGVPSEEVTFADTPSGRELRNRVVAAMAEGRNAAVPWPNDAIEHLPADKLTELLGASGLPSILVLEPSPPVASQVTFERDGGEQWTLTLDLAWVPPAPHSRFAAVGRWGATTIELAVGDAIEFWASPSLERETTSAQAAEKLRLEYWMGVASAVTISGLIPDDDWRVPYRSAADPLRLAIVEDLATFFSNLAVIEGALGTSLVNWVEEMARRDPAGLLEEHEAAAYIAKIVTDGGGEETSLQVSVRRPELLPSLLDELRRESTRSVRYRFLGRLLELGLGDYDFARLAIQDIKPLVNEPSSAAWVTVANDDGSPIRFKLRIPRG
jgi:hypothetical protein